MVKFETVSDRDRNWGNMTNGGSQRKHGFQSKSRTQIFIDRSMWYRENSFAQVKTKSNVFEMKELMFQANISGPVAHEPSNLT